MITTIRNANAVHKDKLDTPYSTLKEAIVKVMREEGFVRTYKRVEAKPQHILRVYLREEGEKASSIIGLRRVSKPGLRVYVPRQKVPRVLGGLGIAILSTPKGILTDRQARKEKVGGEVICYVW